LRTVLCQSWAELFVLSDLQPVTPGDAEAAEAAVRILAPELDAIADALLTRGLGHGLLHLPRWSDAAP